MLTENDYKIIESALGITGVQEAFESKEVVNLVPKKTKHFPELDFSIMVENLKTEGFTKEKYEEAKQAGYEIVVKKLREGIGLEFEGKTVEKLIENINKKIEVLSKNDLSEVEKQYKDDIEIIRKKLAEKETEISNLGLKTKANKYNSIIDLEFSLINIDVPSHIKEEEEIKRFKKNELEKNKTYFKSQYGFDLDENETDYVKDLSGNVLKDEMRNPIRISAKVKEFAAQNFINYGQQSNKGRGGKDEFPGNNNLLSGVKSMDELVEYATKKGVKKNTQEFDALTIEFMKNNKI